MIGAFLWMPFNLKRDGSNPGIVLPHGGPTGQSLHSFNRAAAALASRGYACIAPNVRAQPATAWSFRKRITRIWVVATFRMRFTPPGF